jgi:hypothetical protein
MKTEDEIRADFKSAWQQGEWYNLHTNPADGFQIWQSCQQLNNDVIAAKDAEIARLQKALQKAVILIPKEIAYPYDADIFAAYPYCSREYWEKEKSIMILFKTERDMIAFDHRESPLNYQDVLAKGKQLYADIYKKYKATQALEAGI